MRMLMTVVVVTLGVSQFAAAETGPSSPTPSCAELLSTALQHTGMSQDQCGVVLALVEPFLSESKIVGVLDLASKVSMARGYEKALEQAKQNPTDDNMIAFAEAYKAKGESQRYERFITALTKVLPKKELGTLGLSPQEEQKQSPRGVAGLQVQTLTKETAASLRMPIGITGVLVTAVDEGSPADRAGLTSGIVIESISHRLVADVDAVLGRMRRALPGDQFLLGYWHPGKDAWERRAKIVRLADSRRESNGNEMVNVALAQWGAGATSTTNSSYGPPSEAIDGNVTTRWRTDSEQTSLQVNFAEEYMIEKVGILWGDHNHSFSISLSEDGNTWTTVVKLRRSATSAYYDEKGEYHEGERVHEVLPIVPMNAKHVRLDVTGSSLNTRNWKVCVYELEAYAFDDQAVQAQ